MSCESLWSRVERWRSPRCLEAGSGTFRLPEDPPGILQEDQPGQPQRPVGRPGAGAGPAGPPGESPADLREAGRCLSLLQGNGAISTAPPATTTIRNS